MTREELQKAYLEMYEKCSALENKNTALEKENEDLKFTETIWKLT